MGAFNLAPRGFGNSEHWRFFSRTVENIMTMRQKNGSTKSRVDFLALMMDAHKSEMESKEAEVSASALDNAMESAFELNKAVEGSSKRALTHDEIVANAMLFYLAGYETTASAISPTLYNLTIFPEKQENRCSFTLRPGAKYCLSHGNK